MSGPQKIDRVNYDLLVLMGRRLGYTWRSLDDGRYQTVRPDRSVCLMFGPVHPEDREYFDGLCEVKS